MDEFTFCSFTYNQERYIVQQLESIKYQIEHYGRDVSCRYLLADDCSKDNTVEAVKKWLAQNGSLFDDVEFVIAEKNQGIVRNYENALKHVRTNHFKILAGDDFFYKNNIFEIYEDSNFVISPLVFFTEEGNVIRGNNRLVRRLLAIGDDSEKIKRTILRLFKYTGGLPAPGIFFDSRLADEGLFKALAPFTWIEDVPEWNYLLRKPETKVKVMSTPLVVYRADIGISQKPKHPGFLRDLELLNKTIHTRKNSGSKYCNPYYYMRALEFKGSDLKTVVDRSARRRIKELTDEEAASLIDSYPQDILKKAGL